ncbi:IS1182 family transposase [Roseateles sp. GG27B]
MAISYRPYEPQQQMLLPASLQDWLPLGHLAYFISDTVDALNLSAFYKRYAGGGARNQPFHPAMMVKLLVYGYATGVFSSRQMQRKLHEDLAFRMLGADNFPKHRTIRDFRALHLTELSELFVQLVSLARELGLVKLGTVTVDGTKVQADASRHKAMSFGRMQQTQAELKVQIDALLERAKTTDEAEEGAPELDIPAEIARREVRLVAITHARERLEKRQRDADAALGRSAGDDRRPHNAEGKATGGRYAREFGVPKDGDQENFTDPECRIMKQATGGFNTGYNGQLAVDAKAHIIIAAELSHHANDVGELLVMVQAIKDNLGQAPEQLLADAGYKSEEVFKHFVESEAEIDLVVALGREGKRGAPIDAKTHPHTAAMAAKMQTKEGREAYRKRKWLAEPPNGWIKSVLGFRQFSLRGLQKAQAEWKLVCLALNLRRMGAMSVMKTA